MGLGYQLETLYDINILQIKTFRMKLDLYIT